MLVEFSMNPRPVLNFILIYKDQHWSVKDKTTGVLLINPELRSLSVWSFCFASIYMGCFWFLQFLPTVTPKTFQEINWWLLITLYVYRMPCNGLLSHAECIRTLHPVFSWDAAHLPWPWPVWSVYLKLMKVSVFSWITDSLTLWPRYCVWDKLLKK